MNKRWLAFLLAITLLGCNKGNLETVSPTTGPVPVTVIVNENQPGYAIPPIFEGLSYETGIFGESPDFLNENNSVLIQLIKNLGKGVLRIGGNSSDQVDWTGSVRTDSTLPNSLTTTDIDHLSAFARATGWPVLFGLNLGHFNSDTAAKEAFYVHNSLQNNLYAFQSGNEPDDYKFYCRPLAYDYKSYQKEWNAYFLAVKKIAPKAHFAGPDVDRFNPEWVSSFAGNEHGNVQLIDSHYYSTGPASDPSIIYSDILKPSAHLNNYLLQLSKISAKNHLPYRISECNSVSGGGKAGVSDIFASALWTLDFMWNVAENRGQGINLHGGPKHFVYTPLGMQDGKVAPRPNYYAMLAFKYATNDAKIIPATINDPRDFNNCSVYACANTDNTYSVTIINKDVKDFAFTVQLSKTASTIQIARLTAPSLTSTTGTTFAGSSVNDDGTFTPSAQEKTINSKNFVVNVPAGSAVVVLVK